MVKKRRMLFVEYSFEIGVITLPAYLVLLMFGIIWLDYSFGIALTLVGIIGTIMSVSSIVEGGKEIKWK